MARQFAISDIHGCAKTFEKLVQKVIALQPEDELFLLGDYVNKGPDSKGVLDFILSLRNKGHTIHCLRGNHEQYLLDGWRYEWERIAFMNRGGLATVRSFGVTDVREIPEKYLQFLRALPLYVETKKYLLIHAGLNFDLADPFKDDYSMLNIRKMQVDKSKTGGRRVLHGHVPQPVTAIQKCLKNHEDHISIDGGCVYHHLPGMNHLLALELTSQKLYIQVNIDQPMGQIKILKDDITRVPADAIVNAANSSLLGGGGVDGAIHRAGGPAILEACRKIGGCPTGEAVITTAGKLPARHVIHTVGPVWHGGHSNEDQLLANAYRNSLTLAAKNSLTSIAFPNISTGVYGFPKDRAAKIALDTTRQFLEETGSDIRVIFVCFDQENYGLYQKYF